MLRISQDPTDAAFVQDPYPFYERARARGEVLFWEDYDLPVAISHAAVHAALRDRRMGRAPLPEAACPVPDHLRNFYAVEDHSMLELEPPRHTRLRGLVLRAFTSRRIAALEAGIAALCDELAARFPDRPFDLLEAYARPLPVIVIARLLGVPETMSDRLLAWSNAMVGMYQAGRGRPEEEAADAAARDFAAYLRGHVEARRGRPGDDLISDLIAAEAEGDRLSAEELIATCILLLNAGHEATVHSLGNGVKALLESGARVDWTDRAAAEAAVEEILRHDPPLHLFTRHVYEAVELGGVTLRRGDRIGCLLAAANRDPALVADPARFDPARPPARHAAFGAGLHFCVGAPLARLELRLALATLFARRPGLRLAEPPRYAPIYHFHGLERLLVEG